MEIKRTASKNEKIIMSKKEWQIIGKKAGWIKKTSFNVLKEFVENCNIKPPEDIQRHISAVRTDLYFGPLESDYFEIEYGLNEKYSFQDSLEVIRDWWEDLDVPQYCDQEGYPQSQEDIEEYSGWEINKTDLEPIIFGKELASYI